MDDPEEPIRLYGYNTAVEVSSRNVGIGERVWVLSANCPLCEESHKPSKAEGKYRNVVRYKLRKTLEMHMRREHGMPTLHPKNVRRSPEPEPPHLPNHL